MTNYSHTFKSGAKVNTVYRAAKFFFHHVPKYNIPPLISRKKKNAYKTSAHNPRPHFSEIRF